MTDTRVRVLVVEDDDIVRTTLVEALDEEGHEVRAANDGAAALETLEQWVPDVIVLDLMMPRLDGWAFRAEQWKRPGVSAVPIVLLSASREIERAAAELAPQTVLHKPFDLMELLGAVQRAAVVS